MSTSDFAGFWLRFVAFIIDSIILSVVYLILLQPLFAFLLPIKYDRWSELEPEGETTGVTMWPTISYLGYAELSLFVTIILYHTLMESSKYQGSLGKLALELKVTDAEGEKLNFGKALLRNIAKMISSLTMLIGYVMAGLTSKKQALHDIIANALVVKK